MFEAVGIGDLHFGKLDRMLPGVADRLVANEFRKPLEYALKFGISNAILYGDVAEYPRLSYDSHLSFLPVLFDDRYKDISFWVVLGNHDYDEKNRHSLEILSFVAKKLDRNVKVITSTARQTKIDDVYVNFLPHPHKTLLLDHLNVGHFEVKGSTRDNGRTVNEGEESDALCVMGHLHTAHRVRNTYFSGTLYQTNFGEKLPKSFHHIRVRDDLKHKIIDVPNDPDFKLFNIKVETRKDLSRISEDPKHLYKVFVLDGVDVSPEDFKDRSNVVKINTYETETDLKQQLEAELDVEVDVGEVFKPEQDVLHYLDKKKVAGDMRDRVIRIHDRAIKSFFKGIR